MSGYNDKLNPDEQITLEERIASVIFNRQEASDADEWALAEDDCADLSRQILLMVLTKFRPDLVNRMRAPVVSEKACALKPAPHRL